MSDTPKLVKELFVRELNDPAALAGGLPLYNFPRASVGEVVVWLREQGAGEEVWRCSTHGGSLFTGDSGECEAAEGALPPWDYQDDDGECVGGSALVVPLDTEPPKESE